MTRNQKRRYKKSQRNPYNALNRAWDRAILPIYESLFNYGILANSKHKKRKLKRGYLRAKETTRSGDTIHIPIGKSGGKGMPGTGR